MGKFKNMIIGKGITIPELLASKIQIRTTCEYTDREAFLFTIALAGVAMCLEKEGLKKEDLRNVVVLFTNEGSFEYNLEDSEAIGYKICLIVYSVYGWRHPKYGGDEEVILMTYLEELIHHFWQIDDEVVVKEKVTQVMNAIFPTKNYTILSFYSSTFLNNELVSQGKEPRF